MHNIDTKESFWKIPDGLKDAVDAFDKAEESKKRGEIEPESLIEGGDEENIKTEVKGSDSRHTPAGDDHKPPDDPDDGEDSSDYEMVEVTDDEGDAEGSSSKRQRVEDETPAGPQEFNEDDIAFQLAAMEADYEGEDYDEGEDLGQDIDAQPVADTETENAEVFKAMLDEYKINPYSTWDSIIEEGKIVHDDRYTLLPNMRARKEVWGEWSRARITELKEQRLKEEQKNVCPEYILPSPFVNEILINSSRSPSYPIWLSLRFTQPLSSTGPNFVESTRKLPRCRTHTSPTKIGRSTTATTSLA